jgi:DNA-binding transcriptional LysR family regulator
MDLDQVSAFLEISRLGGFTRASSSLHLSQPAISRRIQLLEQELGAPLFERVHSGVIMTDAGRAFLPHAEALLASVRDGLEAVAAVRGTSQGAVTLALVGTLASTALTGRLRRFRDSHPEIDVRLRTGLSAEVSALVRRGDAEFGLRYDPDPDPYLETSTVYQEPMVPVCPPGHRLARVPRVGPAELAGERWISFPSRPDGVPDPYQSVLDHWRAACGLGTAEIIPIDSLTAQKRMVEAGFGLALLPASSVDDELSSGSLCMLPVAVTLATIPVALIRRRHAFHSGASQALAAMLTAWPEQPLPGFRVPAPSGR